MFSKKTLALFGAMALAVLSAQPVFAQDTGQAPPSNEDNRSAQHRTETVLPGRIGGDRTDRRQERERAQRGRQPAAATPEQNIAAAQALVTAAGLQCQVSEAVKLGATAEHENLYEAACTSGPGYILQSSTPPTTYNCLELLGQADRARERDPAAVVGQLCAIPHNLDTVGIIGAYAREAGVTCAIDQAGVVGKSTAGNTVYETGCPGSDGAWLEKLSTGWQVTDCLEVVMTHGVCRFTTPEEQVAGFQSKLANTEASDCQAQQVRMMGFNANGKFYEVKCAAGDGYVLRVNPQGVTERAYTCAAVGTSIGNGCTLSTPPEATAPPPEN